MLFLFKRQIIFILLLVFLLGTGYAFFFSTEKTVAYTPLERLKEQEADILAELIVLNLKIDLAAKEKQNQEIQLQDNLQQATVAERDLAGLQLELEEQRRRLGQLLSFIYRFGYTSFIEVLMSSADFNDFTDRLYLVSAITDHYIELQNITIALKNSTEQTLADLENIRLSIDSSQKKITASIATLQKTKSEHAEFLETLRMQSSELAARLTVTADMWSEANTTIVGAMEKLSVLPEEQLMPDRVSFTLQGMQVEFKEATINKAINTVTTTANANINVDLRLEETIISGIAPVSQTQFAMKGDFAIAPGGKEVIFVPHSFTFGNNTIEGESLRYIYTNNLLKWDVTRNLPFFIATELFTDNNKITIILKKAS